MKKNEKIESKEMDKSLSVIIPSNKENNHSIKGEINIDLPIESQIKSDTPNRPAIVNNIQSLNDGNYNYNKEGQTKQFENEYSDSNPRIFENPTKNVDGFVNEYDDPDINENVEKFDDLPIQRINTMPHTTTLQEGDV